MYQGRSSSAGNVWASNTTRMAPYHTVMDEIHVLLVDHDPKGLFEIGRMLETCSYKVTPVEYASSAIAILSNRNTRFDIVMASTGSPDLQGYKLMQLAVSMSIPFVLLSVDEDTFCTTKVVSDGAFLNIQKPVPMDMLKTLWQHILREKMQGSSRDQRGINELNNNINSIGLVDNELTEMVNQMDEIFQMEPFRGININDQLSMENDKENQTITENDGDVYNEEYYGVGNHRVGRKVCTQWTDELHAKFVDAVLTLGEGRCFPKDIMQLMNVPGLTRMQVASHLQKCRNENWRTSEERKNQLETQLGTNSDANLSPPLPVQARRFGSMPRLSRSSSNRTNDGGCSHYLTEPNETWMIQNITGGSTEPINQVVNNPQNVEQDYGAVIPHHQIFHEINNVVDNGVGTNQYLSNPSNDLSNFSDMNSLIQDFALTPQDSFAGFFNHHRPADYPNQDDWNNPGNYDQWNGGRPSEFANHGLDANTSG